MYTRTYGCESKRFGIERVLVDIPFNTPFRLPHIHRGPGVLTHTHIYIYIVIIIIIYILYSVYILYIYIYICCGS